MRRSGSDALTNFQGEFRRGWAALAACAAGISAGPTLYLYVSSLFVLPLENQFGWSRAAIGGVTIVIPLSTLFLPAVGILIDRLGARRILIVSAVGLAIGYAALANVGGNIRYFYLATFVALLLGAAAGPIGYSRVVNTWFFRHRGLALALTLAGSSVGGIIYPFVVGTAIASWGWPAGYYTMAFIALAIGLPAIILGVRDGPLAPNNDVADLVSLHDARKKREFFLLPAALFLMAIPAAGITTQLQPLLVERGASVATAASLVPLLGVSILTGRLLTGTLIDRFWAPGIAAVIMVVAASGALLVWLLPGSIGAALAGVFFMGFAQGAELDFAAYLTAKYFGLRAYGRVFSLFFLSFALALPVGGITFGAMHDRLGNYNASMLLSSLCFAMTAVLMLRLGRYPIGNEATATTQ